MKHIFILVIFAFALTGCVTSSPVNSPDQVLLISGVYEKGHNVTEPRPITSKYFKTTFGGFKSFDNTAGYLLVAEIWKHPTKRLYTKFIIENPLDRSKPVIYSHYIDPSTPDTRVEYGPVSGLEIYKDYTIEIVAYDDEKMTRKVDHLVQKIRSYVDTTGPVLLMKNGMEE